MAAWLKADVKVPADMIAGAGQPGAVVTAGEVGVLSGAGGLGKTMGALQIGMTAVAGDPWGCSLGLEVASAPVLFASVEDRGYRMRQRVLAVLRELEDGGLYVLGTGERLRQSGANPEAVRRALKRFAYLDVADAPLYAVPEDERWAAAEPAAGWATLWSAVDRIAPDGGALVIIDPVTAAFDINHNDAGSVRRVLRALRKEATERAAGVLLIAHSNKRGRMKDAEDADLVSGSAAWVDGVRGVLTLTRYPDGGPRDHTLRCTKANYGPAGWRQPLITGKESYVWRTMGRIQEAT